MISHESGLVQMFHSEAGLVIDAENTSYDVLGLVMMLMVVC